MKRFFAYLPLAAALFMQIPASSFGQTTQPQPQPPQTPQTPQTPPGTEGTGGPTTPSTWVSIQTMSGPVGTYLTDQQGKTLYMFTADTSGMSNCYGDCAQAWPPFVATGGQTPQVSGEAQNYLVGTLTRTDGTSQVAYNGMPLYYYVRDQKPGDISGQGISSHGGVWYMVRPDGTRLEPTVPSTPTTPTTPSTP